MTTLLNAKSNLSFLGILFVLASCVPNRKYLYLQSKDELRKKQPTDSVLRNYDLVILIIEFKPMILFQCDIKV